MSTVALNNLWIYIQSMMLSDRNKQWLADRLIESKTNKVNTTQAKQAAQEKYVRESLTRAINEVREARRTGKKRQTLDEFLNELD